MNDCHPDASEYETFCFGEINSNIKADQKDFHTILLATMCLLVIH